MKKLISAFLAISMAISSFGINGCSVKDSNQLIMTTSATLPPYEYLDENGELAGIDIEIGKAIAEKLGKELVIKNLENFDDIFDSVENNKCDFGMAAITVKDDRKERVSFSNTYANGTQAVIVKSDNACSSYMEFYSGFDANGMPTGVKDGIKIGVQKDTTGDIDASDTLLYWGFGEDNVKRYSNGEAAVEGLLADEVTAVVIDDGAANAYADKYENLKVLDSAYANEEYAVITAKENTELLGKINNAIAELEKDGTLADIINKYIEQ